MMKLNFKNLPLSPLAFAAPSLHFFHLTLKKVAGLTLVRKGQNKRETHPIESKISSSSSPQQVLAPRKAEIVVFPIGVLTAWGNFVCMKDYFFLRHALPLKSRACHSRLNASTI